MYIPSHFRCDDIGAMQEVIRRHPFGLLITVHEDDTHLTHLPFQLDAIRGENGTLEAHLARTNPHGTALEAGAPSIAVFRGPDAYVSPRWYADPTKNVPTWNYVVVHAHGQPRAIHDPAETLRMIGRLTEEHEAYIKRPWNVREAQAHAERLLPHVLAFEIPIARLEGKFKLSQNRPPADRVGVMRELRKSDHPVVREMLGMMDGLYDEEGIAR